MQLRHARNPVIFFINGLGDSVINLPALRAISQAFAGRAELICGEGEHRVLFDELPLRRTLAVRSRIQANGRLVPIQALCKEIKGCDLFVSLVPWISDSLRNLIGNLGSPKSIGFFRDYSILVPLDYGKHSADLAFDLARVIDPAVNITDHLHPPTFPFDAQMRMKGIKKLLPEQAQVLVIHADSDSSKMWSLKKMQAVVSQFLNKRHDFYVFVVGYSPLRLDACEAGDRVIPCQRMGFCLSSCLVAQADIFLGIDSCYLHVADFTKVPSVGIFGPTRSEEFGFRVGPNITLQAKSYTDEIEVEKVIAALECLLTDQSQSTTWNA